jgi:hypothetical protein
MPVRCSSVCPVCSRCGPQADPDEDLFLKKIEASLLNKVELRGIPAITKVFMRKEKRTQLTGE